MDWEKELDEYVASRQHSVNCAAHDEGLKCCLEKEWIRDFIKKIRKGDILVCES